MASLAQVTFSAVVYSTSAAGRVVTLTADGTIVRLASVTRKNETETAFTILEACTSTLGLVYHVLV